MTTQLQEIGGRLGAKRDEWQVFLEAHKKGQGEFKIADHDEFRRFEEKNKAYNDEVSSLQDQYTNLKKIETDHEANSKAIAELKTPTRGVPVGGAGPDGPTEAQFKRWMEGMGYASAPKKSLGELFTDRIKVFKDTGVNYKNHAEFELADVELKTTLTEAAGFAPANYRLPLMVPIALRRPVVADLIPQFPTDQRNAIVYMEETTNTNNAAVVAEGAVKPESAFLFTQRTVNIEVIATTLPVSEQQLDDIPMLMALINQRLTLQVQLAEESQLLTGTGVAGTSLMGFLNKPGVLTQARGTDPDETAIFNAITQVRTTGFAEPDGLIMHPTNWATIVTHQTTIGSYVWAAGMSMGPGSGGQGLGMDIAPGGAGFTQTANRLNAADFATNPNLINTSLGVVGAADLGRNRLWGVPTVITPAMTLNSALVGEFQAYSMLARRMGITFQVGWANDDMLRNLRRIRCEERAALLVLRPSAFAQITGLN